MRFKFNILRLMLAAAVLAAAFALSKVLGNASILVALLVGMPLAGIALMATMRDIVPILIMYFFSGGGAFVALCLRPAVHRPWDGPDELSQAMMGAIIGVVIAVTLSHVFSGADKNGQN